MCDVMNKRFGIKGKECYLENDREHPKVCVNLQTDVR